MTPLLFEGDPSLVADVSSCIHCGFCLPTCPTYVLWGEEMDSPRGRIHLIGQALDGVDVGDALTEHVDRCLGCMACVTACPSGVRYDRLITATRAHVEERAPRSWRERALRSAVFAIFPHPRRLSLVAGALGWYQRSGASALVQRSRLHDRLPAAVRAMEAMAPAVTRSEPLPERVPAIVQAGTDRDAARGTVGLLTGCVQRVFYSDVNHATARVLAAEGFDLVVPPAQGCCGALSGHAGRRDEARAYARRLIDTFETAGVSTIIVNSAGCGSAMKEYAELLADDPAYAARATRFAAGVRDIAEFLGSIEPWATRHPLSVSVAYHDACHLAHAQGIRSEPRALLEQIPGLDLREIGSPEICCGSAGIYNVLQPEAGEALGERKAASVAATGASLLVAANPGCLLQISASLARAGIPLPTAHTIQVIDASIRGVPVR